jgi:hypothetical protein
MKTSFQPGRLGAVLLSAGLSSGFFAPRAHALTLQEAYALKGNGKVAAELLLQASGAPRGNMVVSALAQPGAASTLLADLNALGLEHGARAGRLVTGRLPYSAVRHLEPLASLHSLRPSHALFQAAADPGAGRQGSIVSQGDTEMYAQSARTRFQVDGTGVKVGVLSNSYDCDGLVRLGTVNTAARAVQTGDLPADVQVIEDSTQCVGVDEGRIMLNVIHDLAPRAVLAFHTADNGAADMANGIRALADAGATVIVDDTVYLDEPVYQDGGVIADAVKDVVARSVTYIAAAGNFGRKTYEAPFRASGVTQTIQGRTVELHDFDPGPGVDTCQKITIYDGGRIALALHWDQPYASIGGGLGAMSDLDLFLMDENCQQIYQTPDSKGMPAEIGVAATNNLKGDPVETLIVRAPLPAPWPASPASFHTYGIAIGRVIGPAPSLIRITYASGNMHYHIPINAIEFMEAENRPPETAEYTQDGPTLFGHASLSDVVTVGAVRAQVQRVYQDNDKMVDIGSHRTEPFSALGGTEILLNNQGISLGQPIQRYKPDVAGIDGMKVLVWTSLGGTSGIFFGTSAAAAHVGGLVALAKQAAPGTTPAQIAEALRQTAQDLDDTLTPAFDTGFDFATGYGLADGENLIARLLGQPETPRGKDEPKPKPVADLCGSPTVTLHPDARYRGTRGSDVAKGAEGNERILGRQGDDVLCGEAGRDQLKGGPGNDVIEGGPGNDMLSGGPGADVFRFAGAGIGQDRIMDLGRDDTIEIVGLDANGDGQVDSADVVIGNLADGSGTVITFKDRSGDRIVIRGRKAARVVQALRFSP